MWHVIHKHGAGFPAPSQCNPGLTVLGTVCATKDDGACGMWLDGQKFGRGNVGGKGHTKRKSRDDCLDLCNRTKGCTGVAWHEARKRCALKSLEDDERATVHEGMSAYRVCPQASCGGVDEPVCKDQGVAPYWVLQPPIPHLGTCLVIITYWTPKKQAM